MADCVEQAVPRRIELREVVVTRLYDEGWPRAQWCTRTSGRWPQAQRGVAASALGAQPVLDRDGGRIERLFQQQARVVRGRLFSQERRLPILFAEAVKDGGHARGDGSMSGIVAVGKRLNTVRSSHIALVLATRNVPIVCGGG